MKNLIERLFGACMLALLAGCGSDGTDPMNGGTPLAAPSPVVTVEGDTATVRWSAVENAHQYGWELKNDADETVQSGTVFASAYSFTMEEERLYSFRVMAKARPNSEFRDSEWSDYVTASSNMLPAPKPAVDEKTLTDTSATLEWQAVEEAGSYKYQLTDKSGETVKEGSETGLSVTFDDLTEGTEYRFRAMSVSKEAGKSDSPWSAYVNFKTRAHEKLATPAPTVSNRTAASAAVNWPTVAKAAKYAYKLYEAALETTPVKEGETAETNVVLGDLKELTDYYFTLRAVADETDPYMSDSDESAPVKFRTKSSSAVEFDPELPKHEQDGILRAFPGAEGAGMFTTGGRGGAVYHVQNLNDSGPGSLREAVGRAGIRTIVFDVAGNIELKSTLKIANGNLTIAGQTAPGDGICIKGYGVEVDADNVIIRYLRFRPGDENGNDGTDALGGRYMQNIIIDHCSMSWSTDECVSFYVNRNMTMQYCLAYESLRNGGHGKGSHGYGGIWGGAPASFHHNILAHHDSRNPRLDSPEQYGDGPTPGATAKTKGINRTDRKLDFRNNVVYNFCNYPAYGGVDITMNFVGNYYKWGPASVNGCGPSYKYSSSTGQNTEGANKANHRDYFCSADTYYDNNGVSSTPEGCVTGNPKIYTAGNSNVLDSSLSPNLDSRKATNNNQNGFIAGTTSGSKGSCPWAPVWNSTNYPIVTIPDGKACSVTTHTANEAFNVLVQYCGASLRQDAADKRVLQDVLNGTGTSGENTTTTNAKGMKRSWYGIIDSQNDKGGYPTLTATQEELDRVKDSDGDGIPDYYEDLFGLDSDNKADGNEKTLDPQGLYTNLEIYLHYLVKDITKAQTATGTYAEIK